MILAWLLIIPLLAGLLALGLGARGAWPRRISLIALALDLALLVALWAGAYAGPPAPGPWLSELVVPWIPRFGIRFHLGADGLSLLFLSLTILLGFMAVSSSWTEIRERVGFFYFNLLFAVAGILGVFLALDLFLFVFFWEAMLVPMYLLIGLWGHEGRRRAALKFFLFTQAGGLLLLVSVLGLYSARVAAGGAPSFDYEELLGTPMGEGLAFWLMLGSFAAFAVKLPAVPLHPWLPDAHTEAPTAGSVLLAGILLKTGGYGLLRFTIPLFPEAAARFAPVAMTLGVVGILYGALLSFAQTDLKRLVAYSSISHLGFVLLGAFAANALAQRGAVVQMLAHGLSAGALFMLVGSLEERLHTRDLGRMGGLWSVAPRMGALALFFAMASLGLPGLGNFVGEILVLLGAYPEGAARVAAAAAGFVLATVYSLRILQRAFYGPRREGLAPPDLSARELVALLVLGAALLFLGLYPKPVLDVAAPGPRGRSAVIFSGR